MMINRGIWIGLAVSIAAAIIVMIITFIVMRRKINKIKKEALANLPNEKFGSNKVFSRSDAGELLWELKNKYKNPLSDLQMELLINTAIRNNYKTYHFINFQSDYEALTLNKKAKMKASKMQPDLTIINPHENLNDAFDLEYKKLRVKKMIVIVNAAKKNKNVKKLIAYLKLIKASFDYSTIDKGVLFIVK